MNMPDGLAHKSHWYREGSYPDALRQRTQDEALTQFMDFENKGATKTTSPKVNIIGN